MRRRVFLTGVAVAATGTAGCAAPDGGPGTGDGTAGGTDSAPRLVESALVVTGRTGGTVTHEATVETTGGSVAVTGTIPGRDGCETAELGEVSYDAGERVLSVTVQTVDGEGGGDVCTQGIVEVDYVATFTFEGGLPERVRVTHDGAGERTVAADTTRSA